MIDYKLHNSKEAEYVCNRVLPRLQHTNGTIVLPNVQILMANMRFIKEDESILGFCKNMAL